MKEEKEAGMICQGEQKLDDSSSGGLKKKKIFILVFLFIFGTLSVPCNRGAYIVRQMVDKEPKTDLTLKLK